MLDTESSQPAGLMSRPMTNVNGILPVMNNATMEAVAEARARAENVNNSTIVQSLAAHVRRCWTEAYQAKQQTIEPRMLQSIRQRRGEYDPEVLAEIQKQGGTEVYMMLTSGKFRAATAWLRDTLLGVKDEKPWTVDATIEPSLSPADIQAAQQQAAEEAMAIEEMVGQPVIGPDAMRGLIQKSSGRMIANLRETAKKRVARMESKMEDQLQEGRFYDSFAQFLDDITTFPSAILKGPVIRNKPVLKWKQTATGEYEPDVTTALVKEWDRVDPFMIYPSPNSAGVHDGYLIERHRLRRIDLEALKGVEGYKSEAIDEVLKTYGRGGLHEWLSVDTEKAQAEGKDTLAVTSNSEGLIDALQFWGTVQGQWLIDWGMDKESVPEATKEYNCEIWLIGSWVIKAVLNYDPFGRKPYFKTSYEEIPGAFWGNSVADLIRDCQTVCNAAARSLVNNMALASGPQVTVNVSRLPSGEDVTEMYPWKIWQFTSDPYASTAPAIDFFQPNIMAAELMGIYERFSVLADEYSSIPKYITGDSSPGGAGRTASGLSMLMGNAGKGIKQVISNIDQYVLKPAIERLYYYNMRYEKDPELKGDVQIVARGANSLVVKEQAQVRRNEFLQIALNSEKAGAIIGDEGVAALLREGAKSLDMDVDQIVPSKEVLRGRMVQLQQQQMAQQQLQQQQGPVTGSGQSLQNGAPITDNFSPARQG
jgi:hypothetical protein